MLYYYFYDESIGFISILMFSIFLSQATYPLAEKSIEMDVDEIMCDDDITSSLNPFQMLKKSVKKINVEILRLVFIQPQMEEIREKIDRLMMRAQSLNVSCGIFN
jgi:hypothetical protein